VAVEGNNYDFEVEVVEVTLETVRVVD